MENNTDMVHDRSSLTTGLPQKHDILHTIFGDYRVILRLLCGVLLCDVVSVCGLVTNIIVMVVFHRQGIMAESSTVSLFALALSDFLVQLSHLSLAIPDVIEFAEENKFIGRQYIDPLLVKNLGFRAKMTLGHVICWLTAYLSFERCFSVLFPFKVKRVFSPRNSLIAVVCIYAGTVFTLFPLITAIGITKKNVNNMTIITLYDQTIFSHEVLVAAIMLNPLALRNIGIIIVVLCNILILIKVKSSREWRKANAAISSLSSTSSKTNETINVKNDTASKNRNSFQKEAKLIKMISMISAIFLFCTASDMIAATLTESGFAFYWDDNWMAIYSVVFFLESVNSCVNIFVYYFMSSAFKKGFRQLFGLDKK